MIGMREQWVLGLSLLVGVVGALCLSLSARLATGYAPGLRPSQFQSMIGQRAPLRALQSDDGQSVSLAPGAAAGSTLVVFATPDCGACEQAYPMIVEAPERGRTVLVGVDAAGELAGQLRSGGLPFVVVSDSSRAIGSAFGIKQVPTVVLIDGGGVVRAGAVGEDGIRRLGTTAPIAQGEVWSPVFGVEILVLTAVLVVGLYASYTDWCVRRVSNRCTYSLLAIGLAGQAAMVYLGASTPGRVAGLVIVGLAIALLLTALGFWGAGDAKLMWAILVALPPTLFRPADPWALLGQPVSLMLCALLLYLAVLLVSPLVRQQPKAPEKPNQTNWRDLTRMGVDYAAVLGLAAATGLLVLRQNPPALVIFAVAILGYRLLEQFAGECGRQVLRIPGIVGLVYVATAAAAEVTYAILLAAVVALELIYLHVRQWHAGAPGASGVGEGEMGDFPALQVPTARGQAVPFVPFILAGAVLTTYLGGSPIPSLTAVAAWGLR